MSSRSRRTQTYSRRHIHLSVGIGLLLIIVASLLASRSVTSAAEDISPTSYQSQFVANNTTHFLLDVRTPEEFASGHIRGAVNIPVDALERRLGEVPDDQPIVVYCRSGNRSAQASQILAQAGYTRIYDLGGINTWTAEGFPVE